MQDWVPARRINGLFPAPAELSVLPEEPRHLPGLPSQPQPQAAAPATQQGTSAGGFGFHWYIDVWKKCGDISGRARRMEYWTFILFHYIVLIVLGVAEGMTNKSNFMGGLYSLVAVVPLITVGIRRMHDIGKSGWWLLIGLLPCAGGIILLIFLVRDSEPGTNQYGPNPQRAG